MPPLTPLHWPISAASATIGVEGAPDVQLSDVQNRHRTA